ncbi:MAG: hypothetical protein IPM25_03080 [Chloracidobacterium sp.]|nr:hypothetical protein [Chloracidobacterium sp.]
MTATEGSSAGKTISSRNPSRVVNISTASFRSEQVKFCDSEAANFVEHGSFWANFIRRAQFGMTKLFGWNLVRLKDHQFAVAFDNRMPALWISNASEHRH